MNRDQYWTNENFCPAPWTEIYVAADGSVDNCCISNNKLGNLGNRPAEDIILGEVSRSVRSLMIKNEDVPGCSDCLRSPSKTTLRDSYREWFQHLDVEHFSDAENFRLGFLDLRWRNTCNSACVYCGPKDSSLWASELNIKQSSDITRIANMKSLVEQRIHEIEYLYLAGGEPLLIKENEWLLTKILDCNPNCEIRVNTNLNNIDNPIFDLLGQFPMVHWIISGESVGDQYEYVRYGSKWPQYVDNLHSIKQKLPHHRYVYHMVYCALTGHTMFDYIDYLRTHGIFNPATDVFNTYYYCGGSGGSLDPRNLPESVANTNYAMLNYFISSLDRDNHGQRLFADTLMTVKSILDSNYPAMDTSALYDQMSVFDQRRGFDSKKIFPQLYLDLKK